ncbi:MAG: PKD domain-containing protein [Bacteroidales bacterium]|jgi:hypothetical protein|nr:PKD domain-containing protein [Bacteroidales bacterium]
MKKLKFLSILLAITVLFTNCEEEDIVKVDFEIIVTGESPNAIVQLTNTSDDADSFTWTFSEGADIETSTEANPQITVDKTGEFSITLTSTTGTNENTKTKTVNIAGVNGIYSYDDVKIGEINYRDTYGFMFSCESGVAYKEIGLRTSQGETIDMVISYNADYYITMYSPDKYGYFLIPGRTTTKFNSNQNNTITVSDFNNIQTDQFTANLEYEENYPDFSFDELPKVVPFKFNDNKIGLVKLQEILPEYLLIDVKAQKYATGE